MKLFLRTSVLLLIAFVLMGQTTFPQTYYISVNSARARECAETSCRIVTSFRRGTAITVNDTVQGTAVQRNTTWLEVEYNDGLVYVNSSLATTRAPANNTTNANTSGGFRHDKHDAKCYAACVDICTRCARYILHLQWTQ